MNKKQVIRLTESQFHQIVKESVKRVLNEYYDDYNEFDRNGDASDISPAARRHEALINRLYSGKATKQDLEELMSSPDDYAYGEEDYNELRKFYPEFMKKLEKEISWRKFDAERDIDDKGFGHSRTLGSNSETGRTFAHTARDIAAKRGRAVGEDGEEEFHSYSGRNYNSSPINDLNLNVYDFGGKYGMAAQDDLYNPIWGKAARSTIRDTFKAARDMYKN